MLDKYKDINAVFLLKSIFVSLLDDKSNHFKSVLLLKFTLLISFPDRDKYKKKVNDMKKLTDIYNEYKNRELTNEEIYESFNPTNLTDVKAMEQNSRYLIDLVKSRNEKDNITVALLKCYE